jgi:hypothetical protein
VRVQARRRKATNHEERGLENMNEPKEMVVEEGWGFPSRSNKAHYFLANGRSLCNKYGFYHGQKEQGNDDSNDNCTACKKALKRLIERKQGEQRLKELSENGRTEL